MAAALADPYKFVLPVAMGALLQILELLHGFLERSAARSPAFDAAVTGVFLTLAVVFVALLGGVGLVDVFVLYNNRAGAAPMAPTALLCLFTQAVTLISLLFLIFGVPLTIFLVHTAGGSP